ncbi:UTP--glucose-1-phosphate uridylyltransferase [Candidatus Peregrinibacteria bacterium]|nr:UTP--glucose-1-phosphate uridylyltransferase [Candidatus Peregrinibacteria bacterium]
MKVRKAIMPVAGLGTRFFPAAKAVPKELLPIVDKPVIQYLVEEAVLSGIEEIIFVISKGKELIKSHFSRQPELEALLEKRGKKEPARRIRSLHTMAKFHYVYQDEPKGDGHAILCAEKWVGDEPFLVLFGDDIVKSEIPAAKQLLDHFRGESVIAVERVRSDQVSSYGIINPGKCEGRLCEVLDLVEKPAPEEAPSDLGIIGKYVCPAGTWKALREAKPGKDGEIRLIDGFKTIMKTQKVWAYAIEGQRFDTGKPSGLIAANNAFLRDTKKES